MTQCSEISVGQAGDLSARQRGNLCGVEAVELGGCQRGQPFRGKGNHLCSRKRAELNGRQTRECRRRECWNFTRCQRSEDGCPQGASLYRGQGANVPELHRDELGGSHSGYLPGRQSGHLACGQSDNLRGRQRANLSRPKGHNLRGGEEREADERDRSEIGCFQGENLSGAQRLHLLGASAAP